MNLKEFLNKPVAVQLKGPCMVVDNDGEPKNRVEHNGTVYGVPQPVVDKQGQSAAQLLLIGVLLPVEDSELLMMRTKGELGAVICTTLRAEQIQHIFLVTKPGEGAPLIARPGN
jgi:hypothetical protein